MNDFFDSLKGIKDELIKEQKDNKPPKKPNLNRDEFKDIFTEPGEIEMLDAKERRLKDEFMEFIKYSDIKKIERD
ncbi:hypothetical protein [Campylobacter hyointestinalis]|uniref:hypothetical protein n=1 Tax=Campylobacter hyointestinalis TaxID=198 RepID=UPI0007C88540|nr:hypothetical protein [Campylobacter hyointestinalis]ANE34198.1 hypothetical protein CHL_0846 [Campylobacter hyointestinalis subsp. lawsonii CCUG 27631]RAZ48795.1 hypothetical protein CHL14416_00710 [Campylobacter hyointestinalis subsp. lawsonii]RAZ50318.1 hypothetical protein CHL9004_02330 [Campylobacter hyointestinalis subsp. lawsonii]RAZ61660.1 hypothetical protein CHL10071_00330 [Campylobacter hyointestinalis subsp. lawsonii]